jgi:hypothetical protein
MTWLAAIFLGLLIGVLTAAYAGFIANLAVDWLHVSSHEGGSSYFVVAIVLLGFLVGTVAGVTICRLLGGPGGEGALRGFGYSVLIVGAIVSAVGAWAWAQRDDEPMVAGGPIDLLLELRLPPGLNPADERNWVYLGSADTYTDSSRFGFWQAQEARREDEWLILPGRVPVSLGKGHRFVSVGLGYGDVRPGIDPAQRSFWIALPARPSALDDSFGPWVAAQDHRVGIRRVTPENDVEPADTWKLRYRVVRRLPSP